MPCAYFRPIIFTRRTERNCCFRRYNVVRSRPKPQKDVVSSYVCDRTLFIPLSPEYGVEDNSTDGKYGSSVCEAATFIVLGGQYSVQVPCLDQGSHSACRWGVHQIALHCKQFCRLVWTNNYRNIAYSIHHTAQNLQTSALGQIPVH